MPKNAAIQRANQNRWMKDRRRAWCVENGPCQHCGSADRLEVDHIDPEMKASHRVWSWAKPRRDEELKKCQVLCHGCHKEKTRAEHRARALSRAPKDLNSPWWRMQRGEITKYRYYRDRARRTAS